MIFKWVQNFQTAPLSYCNNTGMNRNFRGPKVTENNVFWINDTDSFDVQTSVEKGGKAEQHHPQLQKQPLTLSFSSFLICETRYPWPKIFVFLASATFCLIPRLAEVDSSCPLGLLEVSFCWRKLFLLHCFSSPCGPLQGGLDWWKWCEDSTQYLCSYS